MENQIARRVRIRLSATGLNVKQAEEKAGLTGGFVRDLLNGRKSQPRPAHLEKLAKVLDCDLDYLMLYQRAPRKGAIPEDGLPFVGVVEAGAWRSVKRDAGESGTSPYEADPRFPPDDQMIFAVRGKDYAGIGVPEDTALVALNPTGIEAAGRAYKPRDILIINQTRNASLVERSLAEVVSTSGEEPLIRRLDGGDLDCEWSVEALVLTIIRHVA